MIQVISFHNLSHYKVTLRTNNLNQLNIKVCKKLEIRQCSSSLMCSKTLNNNSQTETSLQVPLNDLKPDDICLKSQSLI